jgi:hypothetical protein
MLNQDDHNQIEKKGITMETLENQLDHLKHGFPFIRLIRPALQGDGIISFSEQEIVEHIRFFEKQSPFLHLIKFVPASGAASRMFKHLFEFRASLRTRRKVPESFFSKTEFNSVYYFFQHIQRLACFHELETSLEKEGIDIKLALDKKDFTPVLDHLLSEVGLNYAQLPKALVAFHNYEDGPRTALEEHLVEAANYTRNRNDVSKVHFTISPEHILKFDEKIAIIRKKYEDHFRTHLDIHHSIQKSSTDTIAVDEENNPFRNSDGTLLFRPAGHGALLANLNELDADIIFIKNIDNIVPDRLKPPTIKYKKLIGGYLLQIQQKIFDFLRKAESKHMTEDEIREMASYANSNYLIPHLPEFENEPVEEQFNILIRELNRPIRVCGMVRNEGELGGGPFWVADKDGKSSLQIVESSQLNLKDAEQISIFMASTHFNPVDLVCSTIDYKGNSFNLQNFVDESTGFISFKSSGGRTLKALELPGLWNGSMARWITVFVETPQITFNPVKTINDLLRDEHQ